MGTVADSIEIIRSYIFDKNSRVMSDERLLDIYLAKRRELFRSLPIRVRGVNVPNPPPYTYGVTQDWEADFVNGEVMRVGFSDDVNDITYQQPYELAVMRRLDNDTQGAYCVSTPKDLIHAGSDITKPVYYPLPSWAFSPVACYWKGGVIDEVRLRDIELEDESNWYKSVSGRVEYVAFESFIGKRRFVAYPRPTEESLESTGTSGPIMYLDSDIDWYDSGEVDTALFVPSIDPEGVADYGLVYYIDDSSETFTFFFHEIPDDIGLEDEDEALPEPFRKYLEFAVCSIVFGTETELYDSNRSKLFDQRYLVGVTIIKKALTLLQSMIIRRKRSINERKGNARGGVCLPSYYPRTN